MNAPTSAGLNGFDTGGRLASRKLRASTMKTAASRPHWNERYSAGRPSTRGSPSAGQVVGNIGLCSTNACRPFV